MITPLDNTIRSVMEFTWPMVLISVLTLSSIRIIDIVKNKKPFVLYKEIFNLLFILYILCLFHAVTYQDVSWSSANIIPFKEILRYEFGSGCLYNVGCYLRHNFGFVRYELV